MRDSESDLCSSYERIRRLHKAPRHTQILCVRSKVSLRVERGYLNSGNERKTLVRDGLWEGMEIASLSLKFYSKSAAGPG